MRKSTVQSIVFPLAALAFMLSLLLSSSSALAACPVVGKTYKLSANFSDLTLNLSQVGTTLTGTIVQGTNTTNISGELPCSSSGISTIRFRRSHPNFVQDYKGTLADCGLTVCPDTATLMYGTFNHNGTGTYGWYGVLQ
jgi:hypothetical protein